jgi:hypothetical protein
VNEKLAAAKQEAQGKDVDLKLEKERARALSERLDDAQSVAAGFESMATQNREILAKLEGQKAEATESGQQHEDKVGER